MAKKLDNTEERIHKVEEALTKTERFIEDNQKTMMIIIGAIVIIVLGYFGFKKFYIQPREKEAQSQMWMAEKYFEQDSLNKALKGDGTYPGFLTIIDDYGMTKSANLAKYYAGMIYLKKGEFQNAVDYLKKFKGRDILVASMAKGGLGDAYMELGETEKALDYYLKAANSYTNDFTTPVFLMKAAWTYESQKNYTKAVELFERIRKEYPKSNEARSIDKNITRDKLLMGK
ncbi:MAG: tetratricopeptide repeat protein [Bacteroidetes bacterium]|nr:tetratricopeptide repeat protein [Bacteroidota bacterium]